MDVKILDDLWGIDEGRLLSMVNEAQDYAICKGILMRRADVPKDISQLPLAPLPFCLVPSRFPDSWFKIACELQPYMNLVLLQVASSKEFLKKCLSSTIEVDEFTANIFRIYEAVEDENEEREQLSLGLIRCDYLLHCDDSSENVTGIKQVESNTISASFGGLAPSVRDLHKYVLKQLGVEDCDSKLPTNNSVYDIARGLVAAWEAYGNSSASILFVIEEVTTNIYDQRAVEYAIHDINKDIVILRCTFKELGSCAHLKNKVLIIKDEIEVAVVYYRVGYVPNQYEPEDWKTRLLLEKSKAIKCPSAGLHLAGTKRVQLQLGQPGVLEKFVAPDIAEKLRNVFVAIHSLDLNEEGDKAVALGINSPEKYVLKPEREGGGNNLYGADIKDMLESIKLSEKRKAYILMERINPPQISNCLVVGDRIPKIQNVTCELGTFGAILGNKKVYRLNNFCGHLLRSKESFSNETGIVAGFGALDSPYLIN